VSEEKQSSERQDFLRRWSRLKRQSAAASPAKETEAEKPPELPALDSLTFESDFKAFMQSRIEEGVKRAALKKLFSDPRFNVMDGLDTYIDDYTKAETIPEEMLALLQHGRQRLMEPAKEERKETSEPQAKPAGTANQDGDPAQDPEAV